MLSNILDSFADFYGVELGAFVEGVVLDLDYVVSYSQLLKVLVVFECLGADRGYFVVCTI